MATKKCKHCYCDIDKRASKCPKCGSSQGAKHYSLGKLIVLLVFGFFIYSQFTEESGQESNQAASIPQITERHQAFKDRLMIDTHTIKDAMWSNPYLLKVGVIDDGTIRNGFASYVCTELNQQGFKGQGISVQVIDIVKLTQENSWVQLGVARCG
ncbi:hypothetical protein PALB_1360 [Pseudoalteromonas luteoviolacea B = ATCC 29581]|nr:hypothetical protein PALB_1360 [Pseudoalteromonas luteoviolacea B = ATCC 29581]